MPDFERKVISTNQGRSGTTIHGWIATLFGVPFSGAGLFIIFVAAGVIPAEESSFHAPRWVVGTIGGIFAAIGVWLLCHGLIGVLRAKSRRRQLARRPGEPWLADHRWDVRGASDNNLSRAVAGTFGCAFVCLFFAPFAWILFEADDVPVVARIFISIFGLFFLIFIVYAIYLWLRWFKYGSSRVEFGQFPAYLGEKFSVTFRRRTPISAPKIKFTLRCVEEQYETTGRGEDQNTRVACYQIYGDTVERELDTNDRRRGISYDLDFDLPPNPELATRLSDRPPVYWELEVSAETSGVDYYAVFLLPVYARPSS